jgi:superfamily II DNA or RNA helicase
VPDQSAYPHHASTAAAQALPPAFPERAAWGTAPKLRAWQTDALQAYLSDLPKDFLLAATPGAGKTTFALRVAAELLAAGRVRRVTVVAPTEHLKTQWADAAHHVGIRLDPQFRNSDGATGPGFDGVAVTYAQVAAKPMLHTAKTRAHSTLVILDEVHHAGDALTWGDAVRDAFDPAVHRLAMTGTPFRSDTAAIPFVVYEPDVDGARRSRPDYSYGYARALTDGVVRPVLFLAYAGNMRWRTRAGDEMAAALGAGATADQHAHAWRTALDPQGEWIGQVLRAADTRLTQVRRAMPDAAGLVTASDQESARAYAARLKDITGRHPVVVLSDDPGSSARIDEFAGSRGRWMVAVRMVSEGVDVPRLAVGVYATSASTPLYFAQVVGRFVRARRRGETASVFLPSVPALLGLAAEMEADRDHVLDRPRFDEDAVVVGDLARARAGEAASDDLLGSFEALEAEAQFSHVLFDGGEFGVAALAGSEEEQDYLGIPGLLEPDQVRILLQQRQQDHVRGRTAASPPTSRSAGGDTRPAQHHEVSALRRELSSLVATWSRKSGQPHGQIHRELRQASGGGAVAAADPEQLRARIAAIRARFVKRV